MPRGTRRTGDRSLFTGVVCGDGSAHESQDAESTEQSDTVSGTLPFLIQDVDGTELFKLFMFLRIAGA